MSGWLHCCPRQWQWQGRGEAPPPSSSSLSCSPGWFLWHSRVPDSPLLRGGTPGALAFRLGVTWRAFGGVLELWTLGERLSRSYIQSWSCTLTYSPRSFQKSGLGAYFGPGAFCRRRGSGQARLTHVTRRSSPTWAPRRLGKGQSTQPMSMFFLEGVEDGMFVSLF